jgi:hypothetical protein
MTVLLSPLSTAVAAGSAGPSHQEGQIMSSTTESRTAISPTPPATLRLRLQPDGPACTLLDGGWWPRSADPAAELPGLVVALDEQHGPVSKIMLGVADWDSSRPGRLRVDGPAGRRVLRLGWFAAMPAGLLTAIYADGHRTDLLIVPPDTSEQAAQAAMAQAAQAGNRSRAPALLAAMTSPGRPETVTAVQDVQLSTWEWEGGQSRDRTPSAASAGPRAALLPAAGPGHS